MSGHISAYVMRLRSVAQKTQSTQPRSPTTRCEQGPRFRLPTYKTISFLAHKYLASLHPPYPHRQGAIDDEVRDDSPQRCRLGSVPPKLVVCVEGYCGNGDGHISERQADIGEEMRLGELEGG